MTDDRGPLKRFAEDFGKIPEGEPRFAIPVKMRMPLFAAMVGTSLVLLALLLWFVVIPAVRAQQVPKPRTQSPSQLTAVRAAG